MDEFERLKAGAVYYYIDENSGEVNYTFDTYTDADNTRFESGNYFKARITALEHLRAEGGGGKEILRMILSERQVQAARAYAKHFCTTVPGKGDNFVVIYEAFLAGVRWTIEQDRDKNGD